MPPSLQEAVPQDAVQPSGKSAPAVETRQGLPRPNQRLLHKVLSPVGVSGEDHRTTQQGRGMASDELLKRRRIASLRLVDQVTFVVDLCVHRYRDSLAAPERFTGRPTFD